MGTWSYHSDEAADEFDFIDPRFVPSAQAGHMAAQRRRAPLASPSRPTLTQLSQHCQQFRSQCDPEPDENDDRCTAAPRFVAALENVPVYFHPGFDPTKARPADLKKALKESDVWRTSFMGNKKNVTVGDLVRVYEERVRPLIPVSDSFKSTCLTNTQ